MLDQRRFESAYTQHGGTVLRYCAYSVGSRHIAEDICAEAFTRYFEKGHGVPEDKTEAWLIRVARNLCVTHHRQTGRQLRLGQRLATVSEPEADTWESPDVWEHVRRLSETERLAVYLRIAEDRPFDEIAQYVRKSEVATRRLYYRALKRLRNSLDTHSAPLLEQPEAMR